MLRICPRRRNSFDVGPLWKRSPSTRSIAFARKLHVHCSLPYLLATPKISSSLAVVSTIIGEWSDPGERLYHHRVVGTFGIDSIVCGEGAAASRRSRCVTPPAGRSNDRGLAQGEIACAQYRSTSFALSPRALVTSRACSALLSRAKSIQGRSSRYWEKPREMAASTISRGNTRFLRYALSWRLTSICRRTAWKSGSRS